ncbi:MAG: hypothetical protein FWG50_13390 [Kiritimatiellaeota bacterium]|nr:hypothetical protein [Kiritimatiellota bacterium]
MDKLLENAEARQALVALTVVALTVLAKWVKSKFSHADLVNEWWCYLYPAVKEAVQKAKRGDALQDIEQDALAGFASEFRENEGREPSAGLLAAAEEEIWRRIVGAGNCPPVRNCKRREHEKEGFDQGTGEGQGQGGRAPHQGEGERRPGRSCPRRKERRGKMKVLMMMAALAAVLMAGCQTADPSSRSNKASYGDITVCESTGVTITLGDGLVADASGGGDTQSNTPTQTTDVKPEVAAAWAGGSAGTGGGAPQSGIVGEALSKLMGLIGGTSSAKLTPQEARAVRDCVDGNCEL